MSEFVKIFFPCVQSNRCVWATKSGWGGSSSQFSAPCRGENYFFSPKKLLKFFWARLILVSSISCCFFFVLNSRPEILNFVWRKKHLRTWGCHRWRRRRNEKTALLWNWKLTKKCEAIIAGQAKKFVLLNNLLKLKFEVKLNHSLFGEVNFFQLTKRIRFFLISNINWKCRLEWFSVRWR